MSRITVEDVRKELFYMLKHTAQNMPDEELLSADFWLDLHMDEQYVMTFIGNLQISCHIHLPWEIMACLKEDNTVRCFLEAANRLKQDLEEK